MLSAKRAFVDHGMNKPGNLLHTCNQDEFITLKVIRTSLTTDDAPTDQDPTNGMFRITVNEQYSMFVSIKAVQNGQLLQHFPASKGEVVRVAASNDLLRMYIVYGYVEPNGTHC